MKNVIKNLICKHEWKLTDNYIYPLGIGRLVNYRCSKCGKEKLFDESVVPKHKYTFRVSSKGNISDGSHTFNELYYHRMILFSVICNTYKYRSWKSWKHDDGTMFDDYFIVGLTTDAGNYTYHYHKDYWNMFKVKELDNAPVWDGHKPEDIIRLLSLLA